MEVSAGVGKVADISILRKGILLISIEYFCVAASRSQGVAIVFYLYHI